MFHTYLGIYLRHTMDTRMFCCLIKNSTFHFIAQTSEATAVSLLPKVIQKVVREGAWYPLGVPVQGSPHSATFHRPLWRGRAGGQEERKERKARKGKRGVAGGEQCRSKIDGEGRLSCFLSTSTLATLPVSGTFPSCGRRAFPKLAMPGYGSHPMRPSSSCHSSQETVGSVLPPPESGRMGL